MLKRVGLDLYRRLPTPLRSVAATAYGYHLRHWRYGGNSERLVAEAGRREHWSVGDWDSWRRRVLERLLVRAAERIPFYREFWADRRRRGERGDVAELPNWPVLEKQTVRNDPRQFLADDCDARKMYQESTSGTSGTPLMIWHSRKTLQEWYALFELRSRRWYGVSADDRWAILGGQLVKPVAESAPPYWVWNGGLRQLYLSSYHLAPDRVSAYVAALRKYKIRYLLGYTSALYELAWQAVRLNQQIPMQVVITNAEPLYDYQRDVIAQAFDCPVRETYGMSEYCGAASECQYGQLHLWPEAGWLEVLEGDQPVPDGQSGDLVFTGLLNHDMPLIRYRCGDRGSLAADPSDCPCGRLLPRLASIEGRCDDVLVTPRGERIGRLDPVFKAELPIREAQIVQETIDQIRVRYVPAEGFGLRHGQLIIDQLRARLGAVEVVLEPVSEVPRGPNGKFRAVVSLLANGPTAAS